VEWHFLPGSCSNLLPSQLSFLLTPRLATKIICVCSTSVSVLFTNSQICWERSDC
jgi:hypothetical protein